MVGAPQHELPAAVKGVGAGVARPDVVCTDADAVDIGIAGQEQLFEIDLQGDGDGGCGVKRTHEGGL